jgi:hypothetical protein
VTGRYDKSTNLLEAWIMFCHKSEDVKGKLVLKPLQFPKQLPSGKRKRGREEERKKESKKEG